MENLTVSQLREVINFINDNNTDKDTFLNCVSDWLTFTKLRLSIKEKYIDFDTFEAGDHIEGEYFYDQDDYVYTREGGILHIDDTYFCDYFEEYTEEETERVYIGSRNREYRYCQAAINKEGLSEYNGDYYDWDALSANDLYYCEDDGAIHHIDDLYYWESDGNYHLEEEETEKYIDEYHNGSHKKKFFTDSPKFLIGFEIEKEDKEVKESLYIDEFKDKLPLWRKEKDGSLDDESGFELISPTYELNILEIKKDIEKSKTLLNHINADKSKNCGGHINISEIGLTGQELFNNIKGYTPLFHALYYGRLDKNYSKGKSNEKLLSDNEKYQSIRIHDNRVEYRIISAVPDFETLIWRAKLMDFILNNQTSCPKDAFFKLNTTLLPLIEEIYNTPEKLNKLIDRVIKYTLQYENVTLNKEVKQAA